jgi:hypothetical protein
LQLDLGDFAAGTGDIGNQFAAPALQAGLVALQLHVALRRHEILLVEFQDSRKFLSDILDFAVLGLLLRREPADFLA